jgi:hypothetical protein
MTGRMRSVPLVCTFLLVTATTAMGGLPEQYLAEIREHHDIYMACRLLAKSGILASSELPEILGEMDGVKGACNLGVLSVDVNVPVTDAASVSKILSHEQNREECSSVIAATKNARTAVESYYADHGRYPATLEEAQPKVKADTGPLRCTQSMIKRVHTKWRAAPAVAIPFT